MSESELSPRLEMSARSATRHTVGLLCATGVGRKMLAFVGKLTTWKCSQAQQITLMRTLNVLPQVRWETAAGFERSEVT